VPRAKNLKKINDWHDRLTGQAAIPAGQLLAKKETLAVRSKAHRDVLAELMANPDIYDQFLLLLTYHTNRIEGSTLTENETAAILFDNVSLPNRSLVEQMEAKNHQTALKFLFDWLRDKKPIDEELILKLHSILMNSIRDDAGQYRTHGVRIVGASVATANYLKVPDLMKELANALGKKERDIIKQSAVIHSRFEQIHPFSDGNGRVGRLLLCAQLLRANFPPAIIHQEQRRLYMAYLQKAQKDRDTSNLEEFLCDAVMSGFNILERK
jgi:Fic family protein